MYIIMYVMCVQVIRYDTYMYIKSNLRNGI